MRGRVDAQFGIRPPVTGLASPNLIQQFAFGQSAAELLQVKEKTPFPTIGDTVQPVIVIDDLRTSARPGMRRWFSGNTATAAVGQGSYVGVENNGQKNDRVVLDLVRVHNPNGIPQLYFFGFIVIGQLVPIIGTTPAAPALCEPRPPDESSSNLAEFGTFARIHIDRTAAGQLNREVTATYTAETVMELVGPFVIPPGLAFVVQGLPGAGVSFDFQLYGHEYPG
jgi:hypothetical protein